MLPWVDSRGDKGVIYTADGTFKVEDTIKLLGGKVGHVGKMTSGMIKSGDKVTLSVDADLRGKTCKNHSATHLLQKALREVLGTHVEQAGSYQDAERTRFDFSHFQAMTAEEIAKVEKIVNDEIAADLEVRTDVMTVEEAKRQALWRYSVRNMVRKYVSYPWENFPRSSVVVHM